MGSKRKFDEFCDDNESTCDEMFYDSLSDENEMQSFVSNTKTGDDELIHDNNKQHFNSFIDEEEEEVIQWLDAEEGKDDDKIDDNQVSISEDVSQEKRFQQLMSLLNKSKFYSKVLADKMMAQKQLMESNEDTNEERKTADHEKSLSHAHPVDSKQSSF